jgi:DNA-binding MarR family transcriptional regulator
MTTDERNKRDVARNVSRIVTTLRTLSPDMPMQQADVLMQIALKPGITMAELQKLTSLSQSSVSRNVKALSKFHRLDKPGLDLVEETMDPRDTRRRLIFLTVKGKTFMTKLLRYVDEDYSIDPETDARLTIERMHEEAMKEAPAASVRGKTRPV